MSGRRHAPWNKGRLIGQKRPLKPKDVWTIRVRLQLEGCRRDLAMFNLASTASSGVAIGSGLELTTCSPGGRVRDRETVVQKKTGWPVRFEITEQGSVTGTIRNRLAKSNWQMSCSCNRVAPLHRRFRPESPQGRS